MIFKALKTRWLAFLLGFGLLLSPSSSRAQFLFDPSYPASTIYSFAPDGTKSTFSTAVNHPFAVTFDSAGDLFVSSDNSSGAIYEFPYNSGTHTYGAATLPFSQGVGFPYAMAFDHSGNLFVASGNDAIYEYSGGVRSTFALTPNLPLSIAFDSAGNLYEGDYNGINQTGTIYQYAPNASRTTFASGLGEPSGLAFSLSGSLYVTDAIAGSIYSYTSGVRSTFASGLAAPSGLTFDSAGDLFEADYNTGTIFEFPAGGGKTTFASGLGVGNINSLAISAPEPTGGVLLAAGILALLGFHRRQLCPRRL